MLMQTYLLRACTCVCVCVCRNEDGDLELKVGSLSELNWMVEVENYGEDAHDAYLWLTLPPGVSYRGTKLTNEVQVRHPTSS